MGLTPAGVQDGGGARGAPGGRHPLVPLGAVLGYQVVRPELVRQRRLHPVAAEVRVLARVRRARAHLVRGFAGRASDRAAIAEPLRATAGRDRRRECLGIGTRAVCVASAASATHEAGLTGDAAQRVVLGAVAVAAGDRAPGRERLVGAGDGLELGHRADPGPDGPCKPPRKHVRSVHTWTEGGARGPSPKDGGGERRDARAMCAWGGRNAHPRWSCADAAAPSSRARRRAERG